MIFISDVIVFQSTVYVREFIPISLYSNIISFLDKATRIYNILWKDGAANALVRAFLADVLSDFVKHTQTTSISFEQKSICVAYSSFLLPAYVLAWLCRAQYLQVLFIVKNKTKNQQQTILQSRKHMFQLLNFCIHVLMSFTLLNYYGPRHTKTVGYLRRSKGHKSCHLHPGVYFNEISSSLMC